MHRRFGVPKAENGRAGLRYKGRPGGLPQALFVGAAGSRFGLTENFNAITSPQRSGRSLRERIPEKGEWLAGRFHVA